MQDKKRGRFRKNPIIMMSRYSLSLVVLLVILSCSSVNSFSSQQLRRTPSTQGILQRAASFSSKLHDPRPYSSAVTELFASNHKNLSNDDSDYVGEKGVGQKLFDLGTTTLLPLATVFALSTAAPCNAIDVAGIQGGAITMASSAGAALTNLVDTGFYQAFSLVFISEIGDKTFFMAGLLAAQTSRLISFLGSMGALGVMTVISVVIGQTFHAVPSGITERVPLDDIAAVVAFAFFGLKTLKDALDMEEGSSVMEEELAEAEEEVENSESIKKVTPWGKIASIFTLVFAAEFGDRSFLSTIALSAAQNPVSVAGGAVAAHGIATGIAVVGGAYISKYLSERVIGIIGGTLFLVFAFTTAIGIF